MIEDQVPAATKQGDGSLFQLNQKQGDSSLFQLIQIGTRNRPLFQARLEQGTVPFIPLLFFCINAKIVAFQSNQGQDNAPQSALS